MTLRFSRTVAAWVAALFLVVMTSGIPSAHALELQDGHLDVFTVRAQGGELELSIKEDITGSGVYQAPEDVTLVVGDDAYSDLTQQIPEIGESTYYLPQSQKHGLLWPGWDTLGVQGSGFSAITFNFDSVSGPGKVYAFETSGFGDVHGVTESGSYELATGSRILQANPAHRHIHWAFTKPGTYSMTVSAQGNGVVSRSATYTWQVGSQDGATPAATQGLDLAPQQDAPQQQSAPAPQVQQSQAQQPQRQQPQAQQQQQQRNLAPAAAPQGQQSHGQCVPLVVPMIKDDSTVPATWRNFSQLSFALGPAAVKDLPVSIGPVPAGKVWMIGSTQESGVPWVGSNNQHPTMLDNTTGPVTWELVGFSGPGPMVVYSQGGLGTIVGEKWFQGANNQAQGSHVIPHNSHVHPNWVFGAQGTYKVAIRQVVTLKNGQTAAGTDTLTFVVGSGSQSGHFDIGATINPQGSNCDPSRIQLADATPAQPGSQASSSEDGQGSSSADGQAAGQTAGLTAGQTDGQTAGQTAGLTAGHAAGQFTAQPLTLAEKILKVLPFVVMGVGLFILGAGTTQLMNKLNGRKK